MPIVPHLTYQSFRGAVLGKRYDLDGEWGAQCWDGVQLLYTQSDINQYLYTQHNINVNLKGYVKTCWTNPTCRQRNGSGQFIQIPRLQDVRRGDVIIFDTYSDSDGKWYGITGHIAFADENYDGSGYINMLGQNQGRGSNPYTGKAFDIWRGKTAPFLGAFRYIVWGGESPEPEPEPQPESVYNRSRYNFVLFNRRKRQEKWIRKPLKRR